MLEIHQDPEVFKHVLHGAPPGGITFAWRILAMMIGTGISVATVSGWSSRRQTLR